MYREHFTPSEIRLLDATPLNDISSEIHLLRLLLSRLLEAASHAKNLALKDHAAILDAISRASWAMGCLVRLHAHLHDPLPSINAKIAMARIQITLEKGIHELRKHAREMEDFFAPLRYGGSDI